MMPVGSGTLISCIWPTRRISAVRSTRMSVRAIPASRSGAAPSASSSSRMRLIAAASKPAARRTGCERTCSKLSGAARNPKQEAAPGAGRTRTYPQQADLVDIGDRAAPRTGFDHVDHRNPDGKSGAALEAMLTRRLHAGGDFDAPALDQAGLGRGAAHVERDHVVPTG